MNEQECEGCSSYVEINGELWCKECATTIKDITNCPCKEVEDE